MLKKKGRTIAILLVVALVVTATVAWVCTPGERVASFVQSHKEDLSEVASAYLNGDTSTESCRGASVDGVFDGEHPIVQFYTLGWGLVPYMGFYYSPDDTPAAFQNVNVELMLTGDNRWEWTDGTDNRGMTKRIDDCWYYYEAWF